MCIIDRLLWCLLKFLEIAFSVFTDLRRSGIDNLFLLWAEFSMIGILFVCPEIPSVLGVRKLAARLADRVVFWEILNGLVGIDNRF